MSPAIEVEGLRFTYGETAFALEIERLALAPGRRTAIIGPSGSGKTTLLHLLAGILTPERGRIMVHGTEVSALDDAARRRFRSTQVGFIFQEFELLEHLTLRENILLPYLVGAALKRTAETDAAAERLAASLGVADRLGARPRRLSHGERQRAAICRALVTTPAVILADEPTGNLDPDNTRRMLDHVFGELEQREASFLMVTHDHTLLDRFDEVLDSRSLCRSASS